MNSEIKKPVLLDQQPAYFRSFLDKAPLGFFINGMDGRFLHANLKAIESLGYSLAELLDKSIIDINPTLTPRNLPVLWKTMLDQGDITFEAILHRKDGTTFPVEVTANILELDGVRFVSSFVQDITERKTGAEALRLTQFSFDKASVAIFRSGSHANILNVNEQACKSLGYTKEELCRMTIFDIDPAISYDQWKFLFEKTCEDSFITFETMHQRKDGITFPVEIAANLFEFDGNKYSISFARDITTRKKNEKLKEKIEGQLRQAQRMEALGTLAASIAHDFNNILSGIVGYADLAKLCCKNNQKAENYINQLFGATDRAKSMVKQILTFSRQSNSEKTPINISKIINEAVSLISTIAPPSIKVSNNVKPHSDVVFADGTQIHQIVMNLCTNSYHAMKNEGGILEVDLIAVTISSYDSLNFPDLNPGKYLKLIVADTGHGIKQDYIQNIFDPYFTTKKMGEGTGMGLSTVHGIVKDHGGTIKVYSEIGEGTTFQIFFPLAELSLEHSLNPAKDIPHGNECILFVDNEKLLIDIGKELLEGIGYLVETRASPIDALEAFRMRPEKYDLIISDIAMPSMTGYEFAFEMKKIRQNIPIILCSGFSPRIDRNRLMEIGVKKVLMKPVILSDLATNVRMALDESKAI